MADRKQGKPQSEKEIPDVTKGAFTQEERKEIGLIAAAAYDELRGRRFTQAGDAPKPPEMITKLYLVSLAGNQIGFPDSQGRVIMSSAFYALIEMSKDSGFFHGGRAEVVSLSDGRRFNKPVRIILTGLSLVALVEVEETVLTPPITESTASAAG